MEGMSDGLSNFNFVGHGGWVRIDRDHVDRGLRVPHHLGTGRNFTRLVLTRWGNRGTNGGAMGLYSRFSSNARIASSNSNCGIKASAK